MSDAARAVPGLVDVVVPVYNAAADLARCVESVLAHTTGPYSLTLIDDASPDPAIAAYFAALAARRLPQLTLLANERNLGFTGTANRGMARTRHDVVLLNSDTIVTAGWLDALTRCAASDPRIGTITPFSNNAEICSFPRFCEDNPWPAGADPEPVRAALAEAAVPCYPDLPTGVGFCMYVRRALIDAIGAFDPAFGAGYGEENDLCLRAAAAGFRNVLCDDAFVVHTGGRSFQGAKETLGARNLALLLARHPHYLDLVREFVAADPLGPLRDAARTAHARRSGPATGVLHLLHGGGGTEAYVRTLVATSQGRCRHVLATVRGDTWRIEEHREDGSVLHCEFARRAGEAPATFLQMLAATFGITLVHVHNLSGSRDMLLDALAHAGLPYGCTMHDLTFACPTITLQRADGRYCGGVTALAECRACLAAQRAHAGVDIARWRELHAGVLARAAFVVAPSRWVADLLARYFPGTAATVIPHGQRVVSGRSTAVRAVLMPAEPAPAVAVLGAIGPDKGARRLERLAERVRAHGAPFRLVLIGYTDREAGPWQSDGAQLTIHGRYEPAELPRLLDHYDARLVLFPSEGPESFGFTLSEAWAAGRPVLVPPIGALAERVRATDAGWLMTDAEWRDDDRLFDRIAALIAPGHADALAAAGRRARAVALPTAESMVDATLALYARATDGVSLQRPPLDRLRIVEAMGYRRWSPPGRELTAIPAGPATASSAVVPEGERRPGSLGESLRSTPVGRFLRRVTPPSIRNALRARRRP